MVFIEKNLKNILIITIFLALAVIYLFTVAPTLSFWDCGEFIASSYTLAIPHPPGTPFYVVLGRVWLMVIGLFARILPISKDVGWHMNLLAIFFSLGSIFLIYKIVIKIITVSKNGLNHKGVWSASLTALAMPFYFTIWQNAVETEVYASASFVFVLINYLVIQWYEKIKTNQAGDHILLLSFYLVFLATGIHLVPFLIVIPIYIFIFVVKKDFLKNKLFILFGIFQIVIFAYMFLLPDNLLTIAFIVLLLVIIMGVALSLSNFTTRSERLFFWAGIFLVFIGFSSQLYLPLRSRRLTEMYKDRAITEQYLKGKNIAPRINMNEPGASISSFFGVLHRSQYGMQKIIPRQTQVQGVNLIQGVFYQVALYVRYLSQQVAPEHLNGFLRLFMLLIFYFLFIYGMFELYKRKRAIFILQMLIFFFVSIGVVGYLNLKFSPSDADSSHQPREVRERDYFFHTSFLYTGLFVAFGMLGSLEHIKKNNFITVCIAGFTVYSIAPLFFNYSSISRYKNFIPRDYGYNLLISCAPGGILFTNGDNDTFPLWFAQEVMGVRRDVIVANLSLINTDWYIRHLKYWGVPISFDPETIKELCDRGYFVTPDRRVMLVKDIMIRDILATNAGKRLSSQDYFIKPEEFAAEYLKNYQGRLPIYFSSTVDNENYKGFESYLRIEGIVYCLTGDSVPFPWHIDVKRTKELFYRIYRYTGFFSADKYRMLSKILVDFEKRKNEGEFFGFETLKDGNTKGLYFNYGIGLIYLGFLLRNNNDLEGALNAWRLAQMLESLGQETWKLDFNLGLLFNQLNMRDSAAGYFKRIKVNEPKIYSQIGESYRYTGDYQRAIEYFQEALRINPRNASGYVGLITTYLDLGDTSSAIMTLQNWLRFNPYDTSAQIFLKKLQTQ
ncbi:MAG: protein O-mannosyl-transferase family [bacterium]